MNYKFTDFKHGQLFKATIDGVECKGRVSVDNDHDDIYLCQNSQAGVCEAIDKFGYKYAWRITVGGKLFLTHYLINVTNLTLFPEERTLDDVKKGDLVVEGGLEQKVLERLGDIVFMATGDNDQYFSGYTIKQLKDKGYTLKSSPQRWEPKEGERVLVVTPFRDTLDEQAYTHYSWGREYKLGLIYPLTHRQQAQEALDAVMKVLKEHKEKIL